MSDKFLGVDVELPTPEEFTKELVKDKVSAAMLDGCIKEYSRQYHKCAQLVMDGRLEEAEKLRKNLFNPQGDE